MTPAEIAHHLKGVANRIDSACGRIDVYAIDGDSIRAAARIVEAWPRVVSALALARRAMQNDYHNKPRIGMEPQCEVADAALAAARAATEE